MPISVPHVCIRLYRYYVDSKKKTMKFRSFFLHSSYKKSEAWAESRLHRRFFAFDTGHWSKRSISRNLILLYLNALSRRDRETRENRIRERIRFLINVDSWMSRIIRDKSNLWTLTRVSWKMREGLSHHANIPSRN